MTYEDDIVDVLVDSGVEVFEIKETVGCGNGNENHVGLTSRTSNEFDEIRAAMLVGNAEAHVIGDTIGEGELGVIRRQIDGSHEVAFVCELVTF